MDNVKAICACQLWHLAALVALLLMLVGYCSLRQDLLQGALLGVSTRTWFWIAIATPVLHQVYVWFVWRVELYTRAFTRRFGLQTAFKAYALGFSLLFVGRLITIILLASSSACSLSWPPLLAYGLAVLITPPVLFLFYSVKRYFTFERAYGIDHFDPHYNEPYVKQGIFQYTDNGMYVFGLMVLYLPGLLWLSEAALLAAAFNHAYIWVHYYFTERPDMVVIYGKAP
ncbi:MAG: methyltransferase [Pseudomonadota bacterium]|nr:methyltransferase [Pseudomonadota bacterium]